MNEGRLVLTAFGVTALIMITVPAYLYWSFTKIDSRLEPHVDDDVGKAFLAAETKGPTAMSPLPVTAINRLLPAGMPQTTALQELSVSGFTCMPEAHAATCSRAIKSMSSRDDWTVRLTFSDTGTVKSSLAERQSTSL